MTRVPLRLNVTGQPSSALLVDAVEPGSEDRSRTRASFVALGVRPAICVLLVASCSAQPAAESDSAGLDVGRHPLFESGAHSSDLISERPTAAGDIDGDGFDDLVALMGLSGGTALVVVFGAADGVPTLGAPIPVGLETPNHYRVASAGDTDGDGLSDVLLGAPEDDTVAVDSGAASVFVGTTSGLWPTPLWTTYGHVMIDNMGATVAGAGDLNGDGFADLAILMEGPGWLPSTVEVHLGGIGGPVGAPRVLSGVLPFDGFGATMAGLGDVDGDGFGDLLVASPYADDGGVDAGKVDLFAGSVSGVSPSPFWTALGTVAEAELGRYVLVVGDHDGDSLSDLGIGTFAGSPSLVLHGGFSASGPSWTSQVPDAPADLGSVGIGDVDGDGRTDLGYRSGLLELSVLLGSVGGTSEVVAEAVAPGTCPATAGAGDFNGDGWADLWATCSTGHGATLLGGAAGPSSEMATRLGGGFADHHFGQSAAAIGDIDGDGYTDLAVYEQNPNGAFGAAPALVWLFPGSNGGISTAAVTSIEAPGELFYISGGPIAAGDFDGDGQGSVLLGWPGFREPTLEIWLDADIEDLLGAVRSVEVSAGWVLGSLELSLDSPLLAGGLGTDVEALGDIDGDGFPDLGAVGYSNGDTVRAATGLGSACFAFRGGAGGPRLEVAAVVDSVTSNATDWQFGHAGDFDGDGLADAVCGGTQGSTAVVWGAESGGPYSQDELVTNGTHGFVGQRAVVDANLDGFSDLVTRAPVGSGCFRLFSGSLNGLPSLPDATFGTFPTGTPSCSNQWGIGDFNGDGDADLLIGAHRNEGGFESTVAVWHGTPTGFAFDPSVFSGLDGALEPVLASGLGVGDFDGDGYDDFFLAAPYDSGVAPDAGAVYVYYGNGQYGSRAAIPYAARALQPGTDAAIWPWVRSAAPDGFDVRLFARSPHGRQRLKVQVEAKPFGVPFDGLDLQESPAWIDPGPAGMEVTLPLTGLEPQTRYHWRARLRYDPSQIGAVGRSRWLYGGPPNDPQGVHVITACSGDADGDRYCDGQDPDSDGDGFEDAVDCEPLAAIAHPGAVDLPDDGLDGDCDGFEPRHCWLDVDLDGWGSGAAGLDPTGLCAEEGLTLIEGDCGPDDAAVHPGAVEVPGDGIDQDCSGTDSVLCPSDLDGDGFGGPESVLDPDGFCAEAGQSGVAGDCDDGDATRHPGAWERCDAIDDDCNGYADLPEDFDLDHDGLGAAACGGEDCNDNDGSIHPGAAEICDGIDQDCDGVRDEPSDVEGWVVHVDADGDGWAGPERRTGLSCEPELGTSRLLGDCDDADPTVFPGQVDRCDGLDTDCDGTLADCDAEADGCSVAGGMAAPWTAAILVPLVIRGRKRRREGGARSCLAASLALGLLSGCEPAPEEPLGAATVHIEPLAPLPGEALEAIVDLHPAPDDPSVVLQFRWLRSGEAMPDLDENAVPAGYTAEDERWTVLVMPLRLDGEGGATAGPQVEASVTISAASVDVDGDGWEGPFGAAEDCDDLDATTFPGAPELCDGFDHDCNGAADDAPDDDGDGAGACADCDDEDAGNTPGRPETCDPGDDDCDGLVDEALPDDDGDLHNRCLDCDDLDPAVFPGATEVCDGKPDSDCDGVPDEADIDLDVDGAWLCQGDCDDHDAGLHPFDVDADGFSPCDGDCADFDPARAPGLPETCDQRDEDCDFVIDEDLPDVDADGATICEGDCDDAEPLVGPLFTELCNGLDNDCLPDPNGFELDLDADGAMPCSGDCFDDDPWFNADDGDLDGWTTCQGDCDDADPALGMGDGDGDGHRTCWEFDCDDGDPSVYVGAAELCDGEPDNDCDGGSDVSDVDADGDGARGCEGDCLDDDPTFHPFDLDGDNANPCDGDCAEGDPAIGPLATEIMNSIDDDCDGAIDE